MLSLHTRRAVSSISLLIGALLVGSALNGSVVTGTYGVLSPAAVVRFVPGAVLIYVGSRLQLTTEYVDEQLDRQSTPEESDAESFDPELSPIGEGLDEAEGDSRDRSGK